MTVAPNPIVEVHAKDEGDFYFITAFTASDLRYRNENPDSIGVPYDPDRVRNYGSLADAKALATEHGATLVVG